MSTFSDRTILLRDIGRLLKLMILYNDDDDTEARVLCKSKQVDQSMHYSKQYTIPLR